MRLAEAADKIEDPLERCLAFPDLPGNQWPKGLARAHCELNHGSHISIGTIKDHMARGAFAELDALYKADLDRHFSKTGFSEAIHADFNAFDALEDKDELDRITRTWLDKAPQSPYALTARGLFFRDKAATARGKRWASQTPAENMRRMHEFSDIAIDHYRRALKIEPRMLPALAGLIGLANMNSYDDLLQWAISEGNRLDPACRPLRGLQMTSLEPRWGGSEAEMQALARELEPYLADRPLLALVTVWPSVDRADVLLREDRDAEAVELLEPVLARTTNPKAYQNMATGLLVMGQPAQVDLAMVYLVLAARFEVDCCAAVDVTRGQLLLNRRKNAEWAIKYLESGVAKAPEDAKARFSLAQAYAAAGHHAKAESEYLLTMKDAQLHAAALHSLAVAMANANSQEKSRAYSRQLTTEYPDIAMNWMVRANSVPNGGRNSLEDLRERIESYERFLELTGGGAVNGDPDLEQMRRRVQEELKQMRAQLPAGR
jgi:tetratricopeptide (TPR) repeat protein